LQTVGVDSNLSSAELKELNELIDNANPKPATMEEFKHLIDVATGKAQALKELLDKAKGSGNINGDDLVKVGIDGEYNEDELKQINELIDNANPKPVTVDDLKDLVDRAVAIVEKIKDMLQNLPVTQDELIEIGIKQEHLTDSQLTDINSYLEKVNPKPKTLKELQEIIDEMSAPKFDVTTNEDGTIKIKGYAEKNADIRITLPDGVEVTIKSNQDGEFEYNSENNDMPEGDVKVKEIIGDGYTGKEVVKRYELWYTEKDNGNSKEFDYKKDDTTKIIIDANIIIERKEINDNSVSKLHISPKETTKAPEVTINELPAECNENSYTAYAIMHKEDGTVETGYEFKDPNCKGIKDSTIFDGKRLKFVPKTKAQIKKAPSDKGGMVIVVDTILNKTIRFGER